MSMSWQLAPFGPVTTCIRGRDARSTVSFRKVRQSTRMEGPENRFHDCVFQAATRSETNSPVHSSVRVCGCACVSSGSGRPMAFLICSGKIANRSAVSSFFFVACLSPRRSRLCASKRPCSVVFCLEVRLVLKRRRVRLQNGLVVAQIPSCPSIRRRYHRK